MFLVSPLFFRGALDVYATAINEDMKKAAAQALADLAKEEVPDSVRKAYGGEDLTFGPKYIIPKPFDPRVLTWVSPAVAKAAMDTGVARKPIEDFDEYKRQLDIRMGRTERIMTKIFDKAKADKKTYCFFPKVKKARSSRQLLMQPMQILLLLFFLEGKKLSAKLLKNTDGILKISRLSTRRNQINSSSILMSSINCAREKEF